MSAVRSVTSSAWTIVLSPAAARSIELEVGRGGRVLETGGILLGHDESETRTTTVSVAGGPGPRAVRKPRYFLRDLSHAADLADLAWSHDRSVWVGEWHTHTSGPPVPSSVDIASYLRHLSDPSLGFDRFISVVVAVGRDDGAPLAAGWSLTLRGREPALVVFTPEAD